MTRYEELDLVELLEQMQEKGGREDEAISTTAGR